MNKNIIKELKLLYENSSFYDEDKEDLEWSDIEYYDEELDPAYVCNSGKSFCKYTYMFR